MLNFSAAGKIYGPRDGGFREPLRHGPEFQSGTELALQTEYPEEDVSVKHMISAVLALPLILLASGSAAAQSQIEQGQKVFAQQKCAICHSIADQGNKKGILDGVGAKLSADEIRQWITNAPEMAAKAKAERKPPMKAFTSLPKNDLDALVAYLHSLKK